VSPPPLAQRPVLLAIGVFGLGVASLLGGGCGGDEKDPPRYSDGYGSAGGGNSAPRPVGGGNKSGGGGTSSGIDIETPPIGPDSGCGYDSFLAIRDVPKLYVVLDRSGSMGDLSGKQEKYAATRVALVNLYRAIGWKVDIGAALFPNKNDASGCGAGSEVFPVGKGDPQETAGSLQGPRSIAFADAIRSTPGGGTPTAATLEELLPTLKKLGKKTFVLLATDGGPNCNAELACGVTSCLPNLEGADGCTAAVNCCAPSKSYPDAGANCLDTDASVLAVKKLADAGISTLVVGIPGSGPYADVLDQMAVAGGVPRKTSPQYYAVNELDSLADVLTSISTEVLISCDLTLAKAPDNPELTNVYLDGTVLPEDAANGWTFTGPTSIRLHGDSCDELESGAITKIQVVVGCPTIEPG
jgi:hypothetical protein